MTDICVPDIGDVDEVEVIELCVKVGDQVEENDPVVVIESDKASMEVPAGQAGKITELIVQVGDRVKKGSLLARIESASTTGGIATQPAAAAGAREPVSSHVGVETAPAVAAATAEPGGTGGAELAVHLPDIGDAKDVIVIEIAVSAGARVAKGELLLVVESDKASMEIPAPESGIVKALHVALEQPVNKGSLLATMIIDTSAGTASELVSTTATPAAAESMTARRSAPAQSEAQSSQADVASSTAAAGAEVYAGPAVRLLAREFGVDLTQVKGSGARGRILKEDVQSWVKNRLSQPASQPAASRGAGIPPVPLPDFSKFGPVEMEPLTRIRRAGAENLHRSWLNVPHVTQHDEADITSLEEFRKSLRAEAERAGVKVTPLSFLVKACCAALKAHPRMNSSLDARNENFILKRYWNIGFAVDAPDGLVVPVIRDADQLGIHELSRVISDLADKARRGKLGLSDMQGGTFSISSLGALGGTGFTPIVNAPEVAILGVGRLATRPVWDGSTFQPREMLPLSLSYDHRAINGAEAGRFMTELCALLSDVRRLIL